MLASLGDMMKWLCYLTLALFFSACNPNKNTRVNPESLTFQTTDSSKLFFKNVRSNYYDLEELSEAQLEVYRFKKRLKQEDVPVIQLALVNNWRYDEAYVLLEPNMAAGLLNDLHLRWSYNENEKQGELRFNGGNKKAHLLFASEVYDYLLSDCTFELKKGEEWVPIFSTAKEKEAFRITLFDYYRLINQL